MLLLVLILVLIAFGLLVVALLSGSVLWAWVSVGVSVAAAAVLLVDWLQRRSAVRAGTEAGDAVPTPAAEPVPPPHAFVGDAAVEPATEVFPVVPAEGPYGGGHAAAEGRGPGVGGDRDERADARETVVMGSLSPSGSARGPSGAHSGIGAHGPNSSQSVTSGGVSTGGPDGGAPDTGPDSEETSRVAGAGRAPTGHDEPPSGGTRGGSVSQRGDLPPLGPDGAPPEEPRDAAATGVVAELQDEVLVVDELPRYHLAGCPSIGSSPVIPLPAREAVDLGFTPCAWCSPDRTLSARHRAPAR